MRARLIALLFVLSIASVTQSSSPASAKVPSRTPVVVDTDIGSDIDDAFALAMVIRSPGLELRAVTTVSGDTHARAQIAARMLWEADLRNVPVAAGLGDQRPASPQARWADSFTSPAMSSDAVALMHTEVQRGSGSLVLLAFGPLTNIAALIQQHPEDKRKIHEIALMGGSLARGYTPGSGPVAESNIASDVASAQAVFGSGIPLRMAPLDVTASLQLETGLRDAIFAQHTTLTDALQALYLLWGQPTPTLHDAMAVALLTNPNLCTTEQLHIQVDQDGMTRAVTKPANAAVAVRTDPAAFLRYYVALFQPQQTERSGLQSKMTSDSN